LNPKRLDGWMMLLRWRSLAAMLRLSLVMVLMSRIFWQLQLSAEKEIALFSTLPKWKLQNGGSVNLVLLLITLLSMLNSSSMERNSVFSLSWFSSEICKLTNPFQVWKSSFLFRRNNFDLSNEKGIDVGDIGPKYGYNSKDNGFLLLNNVKIPRNDMLNRYASVTKDG